MAKIKYSKEQIVDFLVRFEDEGATLWDPDRQLKSINDSIRFDYESLSTNFIQIFLLHPSFSPVEFKRKPVNNIHSGLIYMLDRDNKYGFVTIHLSRDENDEYTLETYINSFFTESKGNHYDPTPELKEYLKYVRSQIRKIGKKKRVIH